MGNQWFGRRNSGASYDEEYGFKEEVGAGDVKILAQENQNSSDSESKMESRRQVRALKKMGHDIPPVPISSIIIFDRESKHLQHFNPRNKTVTQMHEFNEEMKPKDDFSPTYFTSVSIGIYIYVLMKRSMYRLKYRDATATWERTSDLIDDHGSWPRAVVASGSIIIAGGSGFTTFTKSVTKYDPSLNRWDKLKDKQLITNYSANVASQGFVYCIGGRINRMRGDRFNVTDRVERLNVVSQSWDEVESMRRVRYWASAVEYGGNLFVAGGCDSYREKRNSVEKYDPHVNQWTIVKPMIKLRHDFRCYLIDRSIYAVGPEDEGIETYDVERNKWKIFQCPEAENLYIEESVLVEMEQ